MATDTTLEQAFAALAAHRPGADGNCLGCQPDEFTPSPCVASREALAVIETHGVQHWDTPARDGVPGRGHLPRGV
ncbi:MAG: hypothetical protein QOE61_4214 [Micromonosporaceae bacterium]|nr:hypothetical protein [Micromonosporaceae bacterium]